MGDNGMRGSKVKLGSRKIDELGRIVLPYELRSKLDWNFRDEIEVCIKNDTAILKKIQK